MRSLFIHLVYTIVLFAAVFQGYSSIQTESRTEYPDQDKSASHDSGPQHIPAAGDTAPSFVLHDQYKREHDIRDYRGQWVVLYFYPKDMTPGCTTQACNFRDSYASFTDKNIVILGVSKDSIDLHLEFSEKYSLPFSLLSDPDGAVCGAYGVLKERSVNGKTYSGIKRTTFLIDPEGMIARVYPDVDVSVHAEEVLHDIERLRE
jgi:peroxiredoxin Q/BCP